MIQFLKKRWVYHTIIWIVCFLVLAFMIYFNGRNVANFSTSLIESSFNFIPVMIAVYLSFWAKTKFFDSRQYWLYLLAFIIIVVIGVVIYERLDMLNGEVGNPRNQNISNFVFIQIFAFGLQYFKRGIVNQYQLQELKVKTATSELNALKAQLNPHFLFNTLNNIYGMNQMDPEKGSEMIMELSDVMRYHLEFSKQGKVKLEDEIQLLRSYIKLEQLRLRDTCDLQVDFENVDENLMISPLLFIPFVENAFKHGTHPTQECYVHIKLVTSPSELIFTVKNSLIANRKVVKTNIGLLNTKRRLALLFPEKHNLSVSQHDEGHFVKLSIHL